MGTKNANLLTTSTKKKEFVRRYSRQSSNVFTPVDFFYSGNTNQFNHLIKKAGKGNKHPSVLNHELNLRNY